MSKPKMLIKKVETIDNGAGQKMNIVHLMPAPENRPCKKCKKNPRRESSSYCKGCATIYQEQQFEANRLKRRIDEAQRSSEVNLIKSNEQTNEN